MVAITSVLAAVMVKQKCLLLNGALGSNKLTLEKYYVYARAKFRQYHNINPQSNFIATASQNKFSWV